ncbi:hypothetical protein DSO57_1002485 [Entomophthora muscae]|uniref:Uncharacterized protein n=1 Tax=Entomophthora muscae TaxID=34485 RepID=A0ACC2SLM0_9FUNG|nr:hypothetical protein DSO57_1002485 [Entomophthora muscae]
MDFETAQYNTFVNTFDGEVQGCFFHYKKAVNRQLKGLPELSKLHRLDTSGKCKFLIQQFVALAFVKPEHTRQAFDLLCQDSYAKKHEDSFYPFIKYYKPQWIGRKFTKPQSKPRAKASWNCYQAVLKDKMRTNVATKFPALPANVSQNTQGALDVQPLDVSNVMD